MAAGRILITGGTGFIGRTLARELARAGYEVVVLTRRPERARAEPGTRLAGWDGRSAAGWGDLVSGALAVVNLAGENLAGGRWTRSRRQAILSSRLAAGAAVVEAVAAARTRPAVVVQASAVGYYGLLDDRPVDESAPAGGGFLAGVVRRWEESTRPVEEHGVRRAIARSGPVLGPEGGLLARILPPFRWFVGGPPGSGRQYLPWIHRDDEQRALQFLIEDRTAAGPFNLAAPEPVRWAEFARELGRALGRPARLRLPGGLLRLAFGQLADEALLAGQNVQPARLQAAGFEFRHPRLGGALADLLGERR